MVSFADAAPILPVRDLAEAMERYRRLGFDVHAYQGPDAYAYADRDDVHLHLASSHAHDPATSSVMVYLYVSDADALYASWRAADVGGRHVRPSDAPYGLREGAYVDPDGNLLRYGSWLPGHG